MARQSARLAISTAIILSCFSSILLGQVGSWRRRVARARRMALRFVSSIIQVPQSYRTTLCYPLPEVPLRRN